VPASPSSLRRSALAAAVAVLLAGLAVRWLAGGVVAKYGGVALYAVLVYALVVVVAPGVMPWRAGVLALAFCWAVELSQLTPGPAALSRRSLPARLVLGSTFNLPDLAWYTVGIGMAFGLHRIARRRTRPLRWP
jgi:hypothetical protein